MAAALLPIGVGKECMVELGELLKPMARSGSARPPSRRWRAWGSWKPPKVEALR